VRKSNPKLALIYLAVGVGVFALIIGIVTSGATSNVSTAYMTGSTAIAGKLLNPITNNLTASTNRSLVQIEYLSARHLVFINTAECTVYADQILAAGSSLNSMDPAVKEERLARIADAINKATQAQCVRAKTADEEMGPSLSLYWRSHRDTLLDTPTCHKYIGWAQDIAYGNWEDGDKQYSLTRLFADAQVNHCLSA
jgi:hypothetical protein